MRKQSIYELHGACQNRFIADVKHLDILNLPGWCMFVKIHIRELGYYPARIINSVINHEIKMSPFDIKSCEDLDLLFGLNSKTKENFNKIMNIMGS